jgi:DNA repair protein RadC
VPDIIAAFMFRYAKSMQEYLMVIHLGADGDILARTTYASDAREHILFPIRSVVADALNLGSTKLVLAHNHPSGIAQPSKSDIAQTRTLAQILLPLGIGLDDHVIIAKSGLFSFRSHGLV